VTLRVLVTNGATRLSRTVASALSGEHDVRLTARVQLEDAPSGLEVVHSDLGHEEATNDLVRGMDAIVHSGEPDPSASVSDQLDAAMRCTYNLLTAAFEEGVRRLVYLSSLSVMRGYPENHTVTERWRPRPGTDVSALCYHFGEYVCREFGRAAKVDTVCLRIGDLAEGDGTPVSTSALYPSDLVQAVRKALALSTAEKEPVYRETVLRPTWSVFHIQSVVPNARYILNTAEEFLGYSPSEQPH
jgi:uronate dehydrogenase